ncbi:MAG: YhdH/YhfP family quinone oxidoreductase [Emcibacteraceae bacterium]|nr:YhdH/YhfP family quinone oxidoreductase [Emcibacteraceae bacterium]
MANNTYKAFVVEKNEDKTFSYSVKDDLVVDDLPDDEVLIRVYYSTVNYKDSLSIQGNPAITRRFPHTPGIDAAGVVEASKSGDYTVGDKVVIIGQPMGMASPGGFGQYIRVPASWAMKVAADTDLEQTMVYGTAGYTAALSVDALKHHFGDLTNRKIIVTGATGGVGCISVTLLSQLGCQVTAVSGKATATPFLNSIGASEILGRSELESKGGQNLLRPQWDGAIDVAGGNTLATILKLIDDNGCVAATGMVGDTTLNTTVLPFILRGITLVGINAENTDIHTRQTIWNKYNFHDMPGNSATLYHLITLNDLPAAMDAIIQGTQIGRIVVDLR